MVSLTCCGRTCLLSLPLLIHHTMATILATHATTTGRQTRLQLLAHIETTRPLWEEKEAELEGIKQHGDGAASSDSGWRERVSHVSTHRDVSQGAPTRG